MLLDFLKLIVGGEDEDRTHDLRIANAALSQLSYPPDRGRILYHSQPRIKDPLALAAKSHPAHPGTATSANQSGETT